MASFNKVILIGNMTADPELKQTTSGISVCSFSIAINRKFSKEGEQACDFITIQTWRQQAEFVSKYFKKGMPILVCGKLENRSWTDKNGNNRISTEIIAEEVSFVGSATESSVQAKSQPSTYTPSAYGGTNAPQFEELTNSEGLPF